MNHFYKLLVKKTTQNQNGRFSVDTIPLKKQKTLIGPEGRPNPPKLSMKMNAKC